MILCFSTNGSPKDVSWCRRDRTQFGKLIGVLSSML